jgi:hypothetical protein
MAEPFAILTALPMPLIRDNIDTDQIIPSREMKSTGKTGLTDGLFAGWRYQEIGGREPNPDFVMNDPVYADSQIILGGTNFGCYCAKLRAHIYRELRAQRYLAGNAGIRGYCSNRTVACADHHQPASADHQYHWRPELELSDRGGSKIDAARRAGRHRSQFENGG